MLPEDFSDFAEEYVPETFSNEDPRLFEYPVISERGACDRPPAWSLPLLNSQAVNGKLNLWRIYYDGEELRTKHGYLGHNLTDGIVGFDESGPRPEVRAYNEAQRRFLDKLTIGYSLYGTEVRSLDSCKVMLCGEYTPTTVTPPGGWHATPKIDGGRLIFRYVAGKIQCRSRENLEFTHLTHLHPYVEYLLGALPPESQLDGEGWVPGEPFDVVSGIIRADVNYSARLPELRFYVFDLAIGQVVHRDRRKMLEFAFAATLALVPNSPVLLVEQFITYSFEQNLSLYQSAMAQGYEGIVLRHPEGFYLPGTRTEMYKYKEFEDSDGVVVQITPGIGKDRTLAIFRVQFPWGAYCSVKPAETDEVRAYYLQYPQYYLNRPYVVQHQGFSSKDLKPRFPVGKGFRVELYGVCPLVPAEVRVGARKRRNNKTAIMPAPPLEPTS